jgi:hypothetical protein
MGCGKGFLKLVDTWGNDVIPHQRDAFRKLCSQSDSMDWTDWWWYSEMAHTIHDTKGTHDRGEEQSKQEGHAHQDTRGGSVVSVCPVKTCNPICHLTVTLQQLRSTPELRAS